MQCTIQDCDLPIHARGWCNKHYTRWERYGDAEADLVWIRFWRRVDASGDCWLWMGSQVYGGYGRFQAEGHNYAHRFSWSRLVGPITEGLTLDHLCKVRHCVNPDHLEPVPMVENLRRGVAPPALNALKTHCDQGHEFTPQNTRWYANGRKRSCRTCGRRWTAEYQYRQRGGPPRAYKARTRNSKGGGPESLVISP